MVFTLIYSLTTFADPGLLIKKGKEPVNLTPETEISELANVFSVEKDVVGKIDNLGLPLTLNDKFSETPFLYFFNGVMPKDRSNPSIWYMNGHYMSIEKIGTLINVNNMFICDSLKLAKTKDYLNCQSKGHTRQINFDGTIRDHQSTPNICPTSGSRTSLYGNCLIKTSGTKVNCNLEITWPGSLSGNINKSCKSVEVRSEKIYCRRDRIKNSENIDVSNQCLTDSSVMVSTDVFDGDRYDYFNDLELQFEGKAPKDESLTK